MSCCWNIKINEGKCIFLFLKQILAPSSCKFCWPAPNKVSWRGTDGGNDGGSGRSPPPVLLLQRSLSFAGKALEQYFSCQEIIFLIFLKHYFCTDPSLICSACCPELSLLKYIWSRVNCWERIVFDVVCKLSPLDHISPSGTLDITRPPAGRQQLFTLFPFFGSFICVFWY